MTTKKNSKKTPSKITTEVPKGINFGILNPALSHRWRLVVGAGTREMPSITMQVINFQYDLASGKAAFAVQIPVIGDKIEAHLRYMCKEGDSIVLECLNGDASVGHSVRLTNLEFSKCLIVCDYSKSGVMTAEVELTFASVRSTQFIDGAEQFVD